MSVAKKKRKIFDNRYEVLSIIGRGARSVVYHARYIDGDQEEVALKVLLDKKDGIPPSDLLRKEALAMVSSRHKYVIRLDDFHSLGEICYLTMEFAPQADLRQYLDKKNGKLSHTQTELFLLQAGEAIDFIHKAGILHRDLKPENILVVDDQNIRIGDFGVAILPGEKSSLEELRKGVGTFDYLSPEVLEGAQYDKRSDLYALGVTFYELLSGKHPFAGVPLVEQVEARKPGNYTPIAELEPDAPGHLLSAIMKLMSVNPDDRFQNARELIQALISFDVSALNDEAPITPMEQSAPEAPPIEPTPVEEEPIIEEPEIEEPIEDEPIEELPIEEVVEEPVIEEPIPVEEVHPEEMHAEDITAELTEPEPIIEPEPVIESEPVVESAPEQEQPEEVPPAYEAPEEPIQQQAPPQQIIPEPAPQEETILQRPTPEREEPLHTQQEQAPPIQEPQQAPEQPSSLTGAAYSHGQNVEDVIAKKSGTEDRIKEAQERLKLKRTNSSPVLLILGVALAAGLLYATSYLFSGSSDSDPVQTATPNQNIEDPIFDGDNGSEPSIPPAATSGESKEKIFVQEKTPPSNFPGIPGGVYSGFAEFTLSKERVPFSIISVRSSAQLIVAVGIPGFTPIVIDLNSIKSNEAADQIRVASQGQILSIEGTAQDGAIFGNLTNEVTGEIAKWKVSP